MKGSSCNLPKYSYKICITLSSYLLCNLSLDSGQLVTILVIALDINVKIHNVLGHMQVRDRTRTFTSWGDLIQGSTDVNSTSGYMTVGGVIRSPAR